jgi:hypothetical protein
LKFKSYQYFIAPLVAPLSAPQVPAKRQLHWETQGHTKAKTKTIYFQYYNSTTTSRTKMSLVTINKVRSNCFRTFHKSNCFCRKFETTSPGRACQRLGLSRSNPCQPGGKPELTIVRPVTNIQAAGVEHIQPWPPRKISCLILIALKTISEDVRGKPRNQSYSPVRMGIIPAIKLVSSGDS